MPTRRERRGEPGDPHGDADAGDHVTAYRHADGPSTLDDVDDVATLRGYVAMLLEERDTVLAALAVDDFAAVVERVRSLEDRVAAHEATGAELEHLRARLQESEECEAVLEQELGTCDVDEILAIVGGLRVRLPQDPVDGSVHALAVENDELRAALYAAEQQRDTLSGERRRLLEFAGCTSVDQLIVRLDGLLHARPAADGATPGADGGGPADTDGGTADEVPVLRARLAAAEEERRAVAALVTSLSELLARRPS